MRRLFLLVSSTLLLIAFVHVSSANVGKVNKWGCHVCTHNCEALGLKYGEYHCHLRITSKFLSTSSPQCPKKSSYNAAAGRCKCFQGHYAKGDKCIPYFFTSDRCAFPDEDRYFSRPWCTQKPSRDEMCQKEFGVYAVYKSKAKSCSCKNGYVMTARGTCEAVQSAADSEKKPAQKADGVFAHHAFGNDYETLGDWQVRSAKRERSSGVFVNIAWKLRDRDVQKKIRKYRLEIGDKNSGKWIQKKYITPPISSTEFAYDENADYRIFLKAFDKNWKEVGGIVFEL